MAALDTVGMPTAKVEREITPDGQHVVTAPEPGMVLLEDRSVPWDADSRFLARNHSAGEKAGTGGACRYPTTKEKTTGECNRVRWYFLNTAETALAAAELLPGMDAWKEQVRALVPTAKAATSAAEIEKLAFPKPPITDPDLDAVLKRWT